MHSNLTKIADSITKEIKNVQVAFKPLEDGIQLPGGYQFLRCHMIIDVKMEHFCWKVWLVQGDK